MGVPIEFNQIEVNLSYSLYYSRLIEVVIERTFASNSDIHVARTNLHLVLSSSLLLMKLFPMLLSPMSIVLL